MYKGESRQISAVEGTAMYLSRLREITEKWCEGKMNECVIAVPSSFSDVQRQAVLDAAKVANISVLRLMNEHTATALAYGIYRSNDFDPEKPVTVAFCSMGQSIFSVSIVQFLRGKLHVICEKSDKVGGRELDECLMREFSAQFQKKVGCDPLSNKKAAYKLEDAVMKTKKILSANSEAGITCECLMEDEDFASQITREDLEKMCEPAMKRVRKVLEDAKAACGAVVDQIDSVEIVGGGSRVPWVKKLCAEVFGDKDLSTTMNQEESVSRGCALQAAILSPLYKVRDFKVEDTSPFATSIGWMGTAPPADAKKDEGDGTMDVETEGEWRTSAVFPANSPTNVVKTLTFYRRGPFDINAEYSTSEGLLPLTPKELGTFKIDVPPCTEAKKVKVRVKLTLHGIFQVEGAHLVEEEEYEEVVKEKRELPPDVGDAQVSDLGPVEQPQEGSPAPSPTAEAKPDENGTEKPVDKADEKVGEENAQEAPKKVEPKFEWVEVKKIKRRTKKTDLKVSATGTPGLDDATIQKLMDAESAMQAEMREIIETDEKRNDLEAYIFSMRDKISEGREYGEFISSADRDTFSSALMKAEDWLYDAEQATKTMYIDKINDLKQTGDAVVWRCKEACTRSEWVEAVIGTVNNYRVVAEAPGDKFGHIAAEKLKSIADACSELEEWLRDMQVQQDKLAKHEKPVLITAEMEKKNQSLAKMADDILKEPKPAPPAPEKAEEPAKTPNGTEGAEEDGKTEAPKQDEPAKNGDAMDVE